MSETSGDPGRVAAGDGKLPIRDAADVRHHIRKSGMSSSLQYSVIVPFHNEDRHLRQCILSLQRQTVSRSSYELIFIDNASTDRSVEIVSEFSDIVLLSEPEQSAYRARNLGLENAQAPLIAFTDADCVAEPDWLQNLSVEMHRSDCDVVIGRRNPKDSGDFMMKCTNEFYHSRMELLFNRSDRGYWFGMTANMLMRRQLFDRVGRFREQPRGGDSEFVCRCVDRIPDFFMRYASHAVVYHLESSRFLDYCKKLYLYGESSRLHQTQNGAFFSMPSVSWEWGAKRYTENSLGMGLKDRTALGCSLGIIAVFYWSGYWRQAIRERWGR